MNNDVDKDDIDDDVAQPSQIVEGIVISNNEESSDIVDDEVDEELSNIEPTGEEADDEVVQADLTNGGEFEDGQEGVLFDQTAVVFGGENREHLRKLINQDVDKSGPNMVDSRVREVGSWENIIFRAITEPSDEESRIQEALSSLGEDEREQLKSVYRDPETNKILLRTAKIGSNKSDSPGTRRQLTGEEALMAFENLKTTKGGGYRIPLYNSGISVDVIVPTGNNIHTMITNCILMDTELGASQGAHYFAYHDQLYKTQILDFIRPLIVNSSYIDWRKQGKLWSVIKLPDLTALITTIAALCYKDGFPNFVTRCTREISPEHPDLCRNTETFTADIFSMIVTRFSVMSKSSIDFMVESRGHAVRHSLTQIAKYQSELGFEGEKITVGDITFVMKIPTISEHQEAGREFISDIINEIQGDNTDGHYAQFGFRYMRTFLPWISSIEGDAANGEVFVTSDKKVILRALERLDESDKDGELRNKLRGYVNKVQLTYVGRPSVPCPSCGHVADTPSGMLTIDPFSAFFTQALVYSTQNG